MDNTTNISIPNCSKHDWYSNHYTQIKVAVDPAVADAFKKACIDNHVSMAKLLSDFMIVYTQRDAKTNIPISPIIPLSTKRQRRIRAKYHINGLEQIIAAEERSRDNIPSNLQTSSVFENAEYTISLLADAIDLIAEAFL